MNQHSDGSIEQLSTENKNLKAELARLRATVDCWEGRFWRLFDYMLAVNEAQR